MTNQLEEIETEVREAIIILCPNCPNDFEENAGSIRYGRILECPKCHERWINTLDIGVDIKND